MQRIVNEFPAMLLYLTFSLAISVTGWSQTHPARGIAFRGDSWSAALKKAKEEQKLIFVDAYADWCGPCKQLKASTFAHPNVAAYFNTHFVNLAVNAEKGAGVAFASQWALESYPTLYFFSPDGKLILKNEGFIESDQLLNLASSVQARFSSGNAKQSTNKTN